MTKSPLVSVIITTYKNPESLSQAIKTVENQTFKDIEILAIDGEYNENSKSISDKHGVKYLVVKDDLGSPFGVQQARNLGMKHAKAELIAYLDEDDEWYPEKLELQYEKMNPKTGVVSCYSKFVSSDGSKFIEKKKENPSYQDLLKGFEVSSTSSLLIRKQALEQAGGWRVKIHGMQEYDVVLRIAREGYRILNIPKPLIIHYDPQDGGVGRKRGYAYWKIAEQLEFFKYYSQDLSWRIGFRNVLKFWISTALYLAPLTKKWKILQIAKKMI